MCSTLKGLEAMKYGVFFGRSVCGETWYFMGRGCSHGVWECVKVQRVRLPAFCSLFCDFWDYVLEFARFFGNRSCFCKAS